MRPKSPKNRSGVVTSGQYRQRVGEAATRYSAVQGPDPQVSNSTMLELTGARARVKRHLSGVFTGFLDFRSWLGRLGAGDARMRWPARPAAEKTVTLGCKGREDVLEFTRAGTARAGHESWIHGDKPRGDLDRSVARRPANGH